MVNDHKPISVFIGYDPADDLAFRVARQSLLDMTPPGAVKIVPLINHALRRAGMYWRAFFCDTKGQRYDAIDNQDTEGRLEIPFSTDFSFTRFLVPALMGYADEWALFVDADVMFRANPLAIIDTFEPGKAVYCVPHDHDPVEMHKQVGVQLEQTRYHRKNWSSVVYWNPSMNTSLSKTTVNSARGSYLHAFQWLLDQEIGFLPPSYNHLIGWNEENPDAVIAHFTSGTPDQVGMQEQEFGNEWRHIATGLLPQTIMFRGLA